MPAPEMETLRRSASTGIPGLDDIMAGGFTHRRLFLIEGVPGSGKTTLALQYAMDGARRGESVLYVTLSETEEELRAGAESHGWVLDGVHIRELTPPENELEFDEQNTMFHSSDVELASITKLILGDCERLKPTRVVFDSLSELRLLAGSPLRYRRQILALKQFFATRNCTVLLLDDLTAIDRDLQVQSIAHGVLLLEQLNPEYGSERRRLRVVKYRGVKFRGGYHDYLIKQGGIEVFPRLVAAEHRQATTCAKLSSGIAELDALLGGGIEEGTSTLIVGAAGTGKSTVAAQFATAAGDRGQNVAMFLFDESPQTLLSRCGGLDVGLAAHVDTGRIVLQQIDPVELTPGEFINRIRVAVEEQEARIIVIDSLNGYLNAMPEERFLIIQLHELLMYLGQRSVATVLIGAHQGLIGSQMNTPVDASYLADAVILMRYFEARGEVRQAISVMKKRGSKHERTIREFRLGDGRITVGEALTDFRGILTGVPVYEGTSRRVGDEKLPVIESDAKARDGRLLALVPTSKDASVTRSLLSSSGIPIEIFTTFQTLVEELRSGAAAILLPEEAVASARNTSLREILAAQPPWSDLPVLVLTRSGADSAALDEAVRTLGNVTLLERPVRVATLLSAVRTAIRARERQYQIRGHLEDRARAEESLRLADQRKDEFLATLGHELRNPMAPLLTGLQLIKLAALKDPVAARVTAIMERQISHLVRLVDNLLEVSRITRGLIDVQREPLDLGSIVRSAIDTSRPVLDAARHQLAVDLPADPIAVAGDAVRLTQVFANLLTNAAKYTNVGGHIWLTVRREGERAIISIRDDGIGIPAAQLGSVFDMFTQVDRSNRRSQGGLGIGLTLVRSLVTIHGGRVEARSAGPGAGSEFVVELPILIGRRIKARKTEPLKAFPPRRILVVDDNCDAGETLGALLSSLGATVSVVDSGFAALEVLGTFKPDTVLLDIGMPEMDGFEVARRIRATPDHREVMLIALTGWGQEHDYRQSRIAGFDHHLVKPPDIDKLRDLVSAGREESSPTDMTA